MGVEDEGEGGGRADGGYTQAHTERETDRLWVGRGGEVAARRKIRVREAGVATTRRDL